MNRKVSYRFDTPRYRYGRAEDALTAVFDLDDDRKGALRGRLKHFNQLGLPGLKAGKGARINYTFEQVCQWLIALHIAELGIDPVVIVRLVKGQWTHFAHWVRQATDKESKAGNPVFLTLRPRLMSAAWAKDPLEAVAWVGGFRRYNAKGRSNADLPIDRCSEDGGSWLCIRNLTDDLTRVQGFLDATEAADTASFTGEVT